MLFEQKQQQHDSELSQAQAQVQAQVEEQVQAQVQEQVQAQVQEQVQALQAKHTLEFNTKLREKENELNDALAKALMDNEADKNRLEASSAQVVSGQTYENDIAECILI